MAHYVEQAEGATNTTPWGQVTRRGVRFPEEDPERLRYYRTNGRYRVSEVGSATRAGKAVAPSARPAKTKPSQVPVITPERLLALAKTKVQVNTSKKQLLALARDLGVEGVSEDTKHPALLQAVKDKQADILAPHEEGAPEDPSEGDEGSEGDGDPE